MLKQLEEQRVGKFPLLRRRLSIGTFLIIPFAILLATMIAVVTLLSFWKSNDAIEVIKSQIRERTLVEIKKNLVEYMSTAHELNNATRAYISKNRLDIYDPLALQDFFWNQLNVYKHVSNVYFGYKDGGIMLLARRRDGTFVVRQTDEINNKKAQANVSTLYALNENGQRYRALRKISMYDSREQPWYKAATEKKGPVWTKVYPFFLERALGVTAALPIYQKNGELLGVISTDILLSTFNEALQSFKLGDKGEIFIIENDGALVASTADQRPFFQIDAKLYRIDASESSSPVIRAAYQEIKRRQNISRFDVNVLGGQHLVELFPFKSKLGIDWRIGITVSEKEILGPVRDTLRPIIYTGCIALVLGIIVCYIFGLWLSYPLRNLKTVATNLAHNNTQARARPSGIIEINTLASTFNFMADQIQRSVTALKKKNRELKNQIEEKQKAQRRIRYLKEEIDIKQRTKLAGELHDGLGQSLQAINLGLRMLQQNSQASTALPNGQDTQQNDAVQNAEQNNMIPDLIHEVDMALMQLRTLIEQQRPMFLDQVDILKAIESYGMKFAARSGFKFSLRTTIRKLELAPFIKEPIFLIFQEALNNIAKYANAKHATVSVTVTEDHILKMKISDDGIGFDPGNINADRPGGLGLNLMAERAESIDGKLSIQSTLDVGTMIFLQVPLEVSLNV